VQGQADLPQIVDALSALGGYVSRVYGGKQQCGEYADERNDHKQLDQRECTS
jgi:hypothetical protein